MLKKRVIVSVTNDLSHDQRVHKVCTILVNKGYDVTLVGRMLTNSLPLQRSYKTIRFSLPFNKGMLFYACYNFRLFIYLLFNKADVLHANDLDTLPANFLASGIKGTKLIYDSHEYFTEVPELVNRKSKQRIWKKIEEFIFPKLKNVLTVNKSIADIYSSMYRVNVRVLRNVPFLTDTLRIEKEKKSRAELNLPSDKKIIILQGAWINIDRGGEEAILMMKYLPGFYLLVVGGGDVFEDLKKLAVDSGVADHVKFYNRLPFKELRQLTMNSDIGISLDKGTNLNYLYSLPNKLFDYIHAGIPTFVSDMPEVKRIVEDYKVGVVTKTHDPEKLANQIMQLFSDQERLNEFRINCIRSRENLCWEKESEILNQFY